MTDRTRRRIFTVALAPVAALAGWACFRAAGVNLGVTGGPGTVGPVDVVATALAGGLGAWYVVHMLEQHTRRPRFWWPLMGSAALGLSLIGPSHLAHGVAAALALGALHIVTAMVLIWGLAATLPGCYGCDCVPGTRA